jgi:septin 7
MSFNRIRESFRDKEKREPPAVAAKPTSVTVHSSVSKSEQTDAPTPPNQSTPTLGGRKKVSEMDKARTNYVGFANLPNQVFRKAVKKGFQFTLMVAGQSGLGKSTLLNSLFLTSLYEDSVYNPSSVRLAQTTEVKESTVHIEENGVKLELTLVDSPGFGELVDNSQCWDPILNHIDSKYEDYLNQESRVTRGSISDRRVHCCLYFIAPNGHGLKPLDIEFMKKLHSKVNIVPVIAKADTFATEECERFKKVVLQQINDNGIKIYLFPDTGDDEEEAMANRKLRESLPFAVIGSNTVLETGGKKVRGRVYPWGIVEVDNVEHCDFTTLRSMLIRTHMQDLKDVTNNVHYENYRLQKLAGVLGPSEHKAMTPPDRDPLAQFEIEKAEHEQKMRRMEVEMEEVFDMKVQEKLQKLKDIEADLNRRKDHLNKTLESQTSDFREKKRQFEEDQSAFEKEYQSWLDQETQRQSSLKTG